MARGSETAEGHRDMVGALAVHPHGAKASRRRHAMRARNVPRPHPGSKTEAHAVGEPDRLPPSAKGRTASTGPNTSSCTTSACAGAGAMMVGVSQNPPSGSLTGAVAAQRICPPSAIACATMLRTLANWHAWAIGPISVAGSSGTPTRIDPAPPTAQVREEALKDRSLDWEVRARDTGLAASGEDRRLSAKQRRLPVANGEDGVGALAAEFEQHGNAVLRTSKRHRALPSTQPT